MCQGPLHDKGGSLFQYFLLKDLENKKVVIVVEISIIFEDDYNNLQNYIWKHSHLVVTELIHTSMSLYPRHYRCNNLCS